MGFFDSFKKYGGSVLGAIEGLTGEGGSAGPGSGGIGGAARVPLLFVESIGNVAHERALAEDADRQRLAAQLSRLEAGINTGPGPAELGFGVPGGAIGPPAPAMAGMGGGRMGPLLLIGGAVALVALLARK